MVIRDGEVYDERYFLGHDAKKKWMSFSASKLLVGLLTAIAHEKGQIRDLNDPLSKYAPQFKGTAWEAVTFLQALNMTSGVRWNEDDISLTGDLVRFTTKISFGTSFDDFLAGMEPARLEARQHPQLLEYGHSGTRRGAERSRLAGASRSNSKARSGRTSARRRTPFGSPTRTGREMALSGWNAVLRDYARLGLVLLDGTNWKGERLVPATWIHQLQNPAPEFLALPEAQPSDSKIRSWLQAFVPFDGYGDFAAYGTYGQVIYVNAKTRTVVVSHSVNPDIDNELTTMEEQFYAFRWIAESEAR